MNSLVKLINPLINSFLVAHEGLYSWGFNNLSLKVAFWTERYRRTETTKVVAGELVSFLNVDKPCYNATNTEMTVYSIMTLKVDFKYFNCLIFFILHITAYHFYVSKITFDFTELLTANLQNIRWKIQNKSRMFLMSVINLSYWAWCVNH